MARLSDPQLLQVLESTADMDPAAIQAARKEWNNRGLQNADLDELRQRRQQAETPLFNPANIIPSSAFSGFSKLKERMARQHPQVQLLWWVILASFGLNIYPVYTGIKSAIIAYQPLGSLDWFSIAILVYYPVATLLIIASLWYLAKFKKWAYWVIMLSTVYVLTLSILLWPINIHETITDIQSPWFSASYYLHYMSIFYRLINGGALVCNILLVYLLMQPHIREVFRLSTKTVKAIVLIGAILGLGTGIMEWYTWLTYDPLNPLGI